MNIVFEHGDMPNGISCNARPLKDRPPYVREFSGQSAWCFRGISVEVHDVVLLVPDECVGSVRSGFRDHSSCRGGTVPLVTGEFPLL